MTPANSICYGLDDSPLSTLDDGHRLHRLLVSDWKKMQQRAKQDGIQLQIVSSFRDFNKQAVIWSNKFNGLRPVLDDASSPVDVSLLTELEKIHAIQRFSAMPGTSRHHWGTDLDLYDPTSQTTPLQLTPDEYTSGGSQQQTAAWLNENAQQYGFFLPYQSDMGGVSIEPWHISHLELSSEIARRWQRDEWLAIIASQQIPGQAVIARNADSLIERYMVKNG